MGDPDEPMVDVSDPCGRCGFDNAAAARYCGGCGQVLDPRVARDHEVRKTVTILFCDVIGSTALAETHEPEVVRAAMTQYFDAMRSVLEAHRGQVEKFIGDAVVAIFGLPTVDEDDALRAVRAALAMQAAVAELNRSLRTRFDGVDLAVRIGVNTGTVVVGADAGRLGTVATGDAVNVAARLEQAARPGQVLIGEPTWRLVQGQAEARAQPPLALKGKAAGVAAWELRAVTPPGQAGRTRPRSLLRAPLVGRDEELALLDGMVRRAFVTGRGQALTILGDSGVGKSRLATELVARHADSTVLHGRCPSYGTGAGLWPLRQIVAQAAHLDDDQPAAVVTGHLEELFRDHGHAAEIAGQLGWLLGLGGQRGDVADLKWALRVLVDTLARRGPVIVLIEDLQWSDPVLLDILADLLGATRQLPVVTIGVARVEAGGDWTGWAGSFPNHLSLRLEPLATRAVTTLVEELLGGPADPPVAARALDAAGGNPLYVEQLLALLVSGQEVALRYGRWVLVGGDGPRLPPSIEGLVGARLERLPAPQRELLELASVVGPAFPQSALRDLGFDSDPAPSLDELLGADLLAPGPDRSDGPTYRFVHGLIREAAYEHLPKLLRADLHERFARWLARQDSEGRDDTDAMIGTHLADAVLLRRALGSAVDQSDTADDAAVRLTRAAERIQIGDPAAAEALLLKVADLASDGRDRAGWLLASLICGPPPSTGRAATTLQRLGALVEAGAGPAVAARVTLATQLDGMLRTGEGAESLGATAAEARRRCTLERDLAGLAEASRAEAFALLSAADFDAVAAHRVHLRHAAEAAGAWWILQEGILSGSWVVFLSSCPVPDGLAETAGPPSAQPTLRVANDTVHAALLLLDGRLEAGAEALDETRIRGLELRLPMIADWGQIAGLAWHVVGDAGRSAEVFRETVPFAELYGGDPGLSTVLLNLAAALARNPDPKDARALSDRGWQLSQEGDLINPPLRAATLGLLAARAGEEAEAQALADEAGEALTPIVLPLLEIVVHEMRAETYDLAGNDDLATDAWRTALALRRRKQVVPGTAELSARLGRRET